MFDGLVGVVNVLDGLGEIAVFEVGGASGLGQKVLVDVLVFEVIYFLVEGGGGRAEVIGGDGVEGFGFVGEFCFLVLGVGF